MPNTEFVKFPFNDREERTCCSIAEGERFLTIKELLRVIPYSRTHIYRLEKAGIFPRRRKLGPNRVGWLQSEVDAWIKERAAYLFDGSTGDQGSVQ